MISFIIKPLKILV
jgi:hypothetical protein